MSIAAYMRRSPTLVNFLTEVGQKHLYLRYNETRGPVVEFDTRTMSIANRLIANKYKNATFLELMELWIDAFCFSDGPKVFRPTMQQILALEKMKLNIEVSDFCSPYRMIVMEFPDEYKKALGLPELQFARFYHDKDERMFIINVATKHEALKTWWRPNNNQLIEDWFGAYELDDYDPVPDGGVVAFPNEIEAEHKIRRVLLNYCLLLDEVGIKRVGPVVPNEYAQLVKWCAKNNNHTHNNKLKLQSQPIQYGLKAETELVRVVGSASELNDSEQTRTVTPHSRRGHYKIQRFGVGLTERKRIRIPPVIVNAHLLTTSLPIKEYKT